MVFRRRMTALRPVNSIKHVIDTEGTLTAGTPSTNPVIVAVPNVSDTTFKPGDVRVGATVNGVFISLFIIGSTGAPVNGSANWHLIKLHALQSGPNPGATGASELRNQIIHEEKGLIGSGDGTAMAFKGVIAIPKGMRRMREGDVWQVVIRMPNQGADDAQFCLKVIYKSYF